MNQSKRKTKKSVIEMIERRGGVELRSSAAGLSAAVRAAETLAPGQILICWRRRKNDRIQPLLELATSAPVAAKRNGAISGWIAFERRESGRVVVLNFDYCTSGEFFRSTLAVNSTTCFEMADATPEPGTRTQRNFFNKWN